MNWPRCAGLLLALGLHGVAFYVVAYRSPDHEFSLTDGQGKDRHTVIATVDIGASDLLIQAAQVPSAEAPAMHKPEPIEPETKKETREHTAQRETVKEETPSPTPEEKPKQEPKETTEVSKPNPDEIKDAPPQPPKPEEARKKPAVVQQPSTAAATAQDEQSASQADAARRAQFWSAYQLQMYTAIERAKLRPRTGKSAGVLVEVTIAPSGELVSRRVVQSSGIAELDQAALTSLERAAPFAPIPRDVSTSALTVTVPFQYRTR